MAGALALPPPNDVTPEMGWPLFAQVFRYPGNEGGMGSGQERKKKASEWKFRLTIEIILSCSLVEGARKVRVDNALSAGLCLGRDIGRAPAVGAQTVVLVEL